MSTYAIGDIQGCLEPLKRLLDRLQFEPACDRLWFTGDLVNRGPESLATLRLVRDLGPSALTVLGNHDLHLLACGLTDPGRLRPDDTLLEILEAPDCGELLDWLRRQPLAHHDPELNYTLVHAGIAPDWDLEQLLALADEVATALRSEAAPQLLAELYGNQPDAWSDDLRGTARLRCIVNFCTRMRYVHGDGRLEFRSKGPPGTEPPGCMPWYRLPGRRNRGLRIIFGHWSTHHLGNSSDLAAQGVFGIDTGCLWGGALTALNLGDGELVQVAGMPAGRSRSSD
jgi:bis(5'-nucleosyl)-tetraphosphatase (symmetrical)